MSSLSRTESSSEAVGGFFRYSTISGSTPWSRSRLTARREVLQRGLCQTMTDMSRSSSTDIIYPRPLEDPARFNAKF